MKVTAIVPARMASKRLPGKPLRKLGGIPIVVRVVEQARKCEAIGHVAVATDSQEIKDVVETYGYSSVLTSPTHASGTDRVAEAANLLDANLVINLQGDEPFIDPIDLASVAASLREGEADIVTLSARIDQEADYNNPDVVKVVTREDGYALYFSRAPIPHVRDRDFRAGYALRHVGVYGYRHEALRRMTTADPHQLERLEALEQLRALALGLSIRILPSAGRPSLGIDTPEDLLAAEEYLVAKTRDPLV